MLSDKWSRRFAIVMIAGSQFKVTTEDVIVVRNSFYPTIGDRIRLEKVMLVGDSDFSLVGKPLVRSVDTHTRFCVVFRRKYILLSIIVNSKELVRVEATVIEKTLTNPTIIFRYQPRKDNRTMNCKLHSTRLFEIRSFNNCVALCIPIYLVFKGTLTLLRINSIEFTKPLDLQDQQIAE